MLDTQTLAEELAFYERLQAEEGVVAVWHHKERFYFPEFGRLYEKGIRGITRQNVAILVNPYDSQMGRESWDRAMSGCCEAAAEVAFAPGIARGLIVRAAFRYGMPVPVFRELLTRVWVRDCSTMLYHVPKNVLRQMFKYAAFDLSHLPEMVTVYRGGRVHPDVDDNDSLKRGICWTGKRDVAAWFACLGWNGDDAIDCEDPAVVLKAIIPRSQVLAHITDNCEDEFIIFGVRKAPLDMTSPHSVKGYLRGVRSWRQASKRHAAFLEARRKRKDKKWKRQVRSLPTVSV